MKLSQAVENLIDKICFLNVSRYISHFLFKGRLKFFFFTIFATAVEGCILCSWVEPPTLLEGVHSLGLWCVCVCVCVCTCVCACVCACASACVCVYVRRVTRLPPSLPSLTGSCSRREHVRQRLQPSQQQPWLPASALAGASPSSSAASRPATTRRSPTACATTATWACRSWSPPCLCPQPRSWTPCSQSWW